MNDTAVVRPSRVPVVRLLVASSWLVLVLIGLQTAWAGFVVAAALVRQARWRVVAAVGALTSIAMWPAHNGPWFATGHLDETSLTRAYLITWTVLCIVAVVLNARVLSSRLSLVAAPPLVVSGTRRPVAPSSTVDEAPQAEHPVWGSPVLTAPVKPAVQDRVDVNAAPSAHLRTLPGVSRAAARRVVEHRRLVGAFQSLDEFAQVAKIEGTDLLRLRELASCAPSDR